MKMGYSNYRDYRYNNILIVLIAGSSTRFSASTSNNGNGNINSNIKKQFLIVDGKPIFIHTIENLTKPSIFSSVVVVCQKEYRDDVTAYIEKYRANINVRNIDVIFGGSDRVGSVYNAMVFLQGKQISVTGNAHHTSIANIRNSTNTENTTDGSVDYVFIHDGVRPIVGESEIVSLCESVVKHDAAILAMKMNDTVKQVDKNGMIEQTLDRDVLYRAATPQAFLFSKYYNAISRCVEQKKTAEVTDDAQIYSMYEGSVAIVPCSSKNIKITTEDDVSLIF